MKYLPAISLGLSVVLGILAFIVLRIGESEPPSSANFDVREVSATAPVETREVLVLRVAIEAGEPVPPDVVDVRDWPIDLVPEGALTSIRDLRSTRGDQRFAQIPLAPGEPLMTSKLGDVPPRRMLSRTIPEGYRAVSISVTNVTNVSGFVLPGDQVDLMAYVPVPGGIGPDAFRAEPLIDNVLVLGVDQFMGSGVEGAVPASLVTLALKPDDAQKITAAARESRIGLALIGQAEVEARLDGDVEGVENAAVPAEQRPPVVRRVPTPVRRVAPREPAKSETTQVKVVHGASVSTVTAPVEDEPGPAELLKGLQP